MPDEIMGTTLLENGLWVLRHEGGAGNKVPLTAPQEVLAQLEDGDAKVFLGTYARDHRGVVVAANATAIKSPIAFG